MNYRPVLSEGRREAWKAIAEDSVVLSGSSAVSSPREPLSAMTTKLAIDIVNDLKPVVASRTGKHSRLRSSKAKTNQTESVTPGPGIHSGNDGTADRTFRTQTTDTLLEEVASPIQIDVFS